MIIRRNSKPTYRMVIRNPPKARRPAMVIRNTLVGLPKKNLGGFLPDPPADCEKKVLWVYCYNRYWIDLSSCHSCSIIKECVGRSSYLVLLKKQREEHFAKLNEARKTNLKKGNKNDKKNSN